MKVNLHMLREDLADLGLRGHLEDDAWVARCSYPLACTCVARGFVEEAVYVAKAGQLPRHFPGGGIVPSIICIGKPSEEWLLAPCNILYTAEGIGQPELFNRVSEAIGAYQRWEDGLLHILDGHGSAEELGACVHEMVGNPFFLQGSAYNMLLVSVPEGVEDTPMLESYREDYSVPPNTTLSPDDISFYLADKEYMDSADAVAPAIYSGDKYGFRTLYYNIRVDGSPVARLGFDEVATPLRSRDHVLIQVIGDHLAQSMVASGAYGFGRSDDLDPVLQGMLSRELLPERRISHLVDSLGWDMHDEYACLVLRLREDSGADTALEPLALGVSRALGLDCYTVFDGDAVFACNLTRLGMDGDRMLSGMLSYLRDNMLMASLSSTYDDFKEFYCYHRQAISALETGLAEDPTRWIFRAEDYGMGYIVRKASEDTVPSALVPDGLKRLQKHDSEDGTGYVGLLRTYLDHDRNVAESARLSNMHRSTFIRRLSRIEEMLGMDLDDPDTRLVLQVALRAMGEPDRG